jgi:hypothetical protein
MKLFKKLKKKDHIESTRIIEPQEWDEFNAAMSKVKEDSRRKQAASWASAKNVYLD